MAGILDDLCHICASVKFSSWMLLRWGDKSSDVELSLNVLHMNVNIGTIYPFHVIILKEGIIQVFSELCEFNFLAEVYASW